MKGGRGRRALMEKDRSEMRIRGRYREEGAKRRGLGEGKEGGEAGRHSVNLCEDKCWCMCRVFTYFLFFPTSHVRLVKVW